MGKRVSFYTLGCKLNYAETSTIARDFERGGYEITGQFLPADIYVVNTCSVTEHSDKKGRNIIRRLHRISPDAIIAVTGCYAQLKGEEIASIDGVDIVLGAERKGDLFECVKQLERRREANPDSAGKIFDVTGIGEVKNIFPAYSSGERTRSFLKVQDGCNYRCAYCTIPDARGESRNVSIAEAVAEAEKIADAGIREIVLTGVNIGDFGRTTGESFADLLKALNEVDGIERYRISSIEPNLLSDEIVKWIASGTKFMPHFHIPLQSGCDAILKKMGRRYNTAMFREKIRLIRDNIENVFIGIDVIAGLPAETDGCFEETYRFLEEIRPAFIHVFPYSKRSGTRAAVMPEQVPERIKTERVAKLEALSETLYREFVEANRGRTEEVLFESSVKGGRMYGYTKNYIRIERPYDRDRVGKISSVVID